MDIVLKYFSDFSEKQVQQLGALEGLYAEWNSRINVISRQDITSLYERHVLHSLSIAAVFNLPAGCNVIDIGTGGGFPGIPLAIFFPDVHFHLVDSIAKKLKIVEAVKETIGLTNVTTQHIRAEEIKDRKFDFAVTRAVAPLKQLWQWCRPLLKSSKETIISTTGNEVYKPGLICLKGGELSVEISESETTPTIVGISKLFKEEFFKEKYLLYTTSTNLFV